MILFRAGGATDQRRARRGPGPGRALEAARGVREPRRQAGSTIGTEAGARSALRRWLHRCDGIPAGITIAPHIYPKLGYTPLTDLVSIAGFATSPLVVVVVPTDRRSNTGDPGAARAAGAIELRLQWQRFAAAPDGRIIFLSQAKLQVTHRAVSRQCPGPA